MELILVKDKYDDYTISNPRGIEWAALDLLKQRFEDGWYDNWDDNPKTQWEDRASIIVKNEDAKAALNFLLERRDAEYEWIEVQAVKGF